MDLYKQLIGTIETPAQIEARQKAYIAEYEAAQQRLIQGTYQRQRADALAAMQSMSQAGAAAAAMSKGLLGAVGGEYNAAAKEIKGLAGGLTGAINAGTMKDVQAANKALGKVGAPALTEGGWTGYGGGTQAGVENYYSGTIPGQLMTTAGDAATFGLAGQTAAGNLQMTQEAAAAYQTALHDINTNEMNAEAALAAKEPELAQQFMADAQDARVKAITLASSLITAQAGLGGTETAKPVTTRVGNTLLQYDPVTRTWKKAYEGPAAAPKLTLRSVPGVGLVQVLPNGTTKVLQSAQASPTLRSVTGVGLVRVNPDGSAEVVMPSPKGAAATKPTFRTVKGVIYRWDPKTQSFAVAPGSPTQPTGNGSVGKPPSAATLRRAQTIIRDSSYRMIGSNTPLTRQQLNVLIARYNAEAKAKGHRTTTFAEIARMTDEQKRLSLGIEGTGGWNGTTSRNPQDIYMDLIQIARLRPRRARDMVAKIFPGFGADYFK